MKNFKSKIKNMNGITLISLVITIIIMLILAGITISLALGKNGIIQRAKESIQITTKKQEMEYLSLAYNACKLNMLSNNKQSNDAIFAENFEKEVCKYKEAKVVTDSDGISLDVTFIKTKNEYVVNQDATIVEKGKKVANNDITNNIKIKTFEKMDITIDDDIVSYYGTAVEYKANDTDTGTYRIFYYDKNGDFGEPNTLYLKRDLDKRDLDVTKKELVTLKNGEYEIIDGYEGSADAVKNFKNINPQMKNDKYPLRSSDEFEMQDYNNFNLAYKLSTYLSDKNVFSNYVNSDIANYSYGAPSIEMYLASMKQYAEKKNYAEVANEAQTKFEANVNDGLWSGYSFRDNHHQLLSLGNLPQESNFQALYVGTDNSFATNNNAVFASPNCISATSLCYMQGGTYQPSLQIENHTFPEIPRDGLIINAGSITTYFDLTPIIAIKTSIQSIKSKNEIAIYSSKKIDASNASSLYGKVVDYKASDSDSGTYRIFYYDENGNFGDKGRVYLKRDGTSTETVSITNMSTYTPSTEAKTYLTKFSKLWNNDNSKRINEKYSSLNDNEKASYYLSDPNLPLIQKYKNSNKASYVLGAPSLELYAASYNQTHPTEKIELEYLSDNNFYGYIFGGSNNSSITIDNTKTNYLYGFNSAAQVNNNLSGTSILAIASPFAYSSPTIFGIQNEYIHPDGITDANLVLQPIIALNSNVDLVEQ